MSSFDDYLKQSEVESAIANLVSEIYPILEEVTEELTPWEVTTALTILVSNIAVQNDMDKRVLVNFLAFYWTLQKPILLNLAKLFLCPLLKDIKLVKIVSFSIPKAQEILQSIDWFYKK